MGKGPGWAPGHHILVPVTLSDKGPECQVMRQQEATQASGPAGPPTEPLGPPLRCRRLAGPGQAP